MTTVTGTLPDDLTGTADERIQQLAQLEEAALTVGWLKRQLDAVLLAWANDETELDINREARVDY